jgi:hypothetical protein
MGAGTFKATKLNQKLGLVQKQVETKIGNWVIT